MKKIIYKNKLLAIIIPSDYQTEGIEFFTPDDFSQQLAYMSHKKGKIIDAHIHNVITRKVHYTKEVLVIRKGKLRVDFYDDDKNYIESHVIKQGDVILLAYGGHGFEVIEDCDFIEIKQGPYLRDQDKIRFEPVDKEQIKIVD